MRKRSDQRPEAKKEHAVDNDHFTSQPVGQRAGQQRTDRQANQRGANHHAKLLIADAPLAFQLRGNKPHQGNIEAIQRNNDKTQQNNQFLITAYRTIVDQRSNINFV
ncbi:hypothetical protein D3C81_752780 [compost metagenome]